MGSDFSNGTRIWGLSSLSGEEPLEEQYQRAAARSERGPESLERLEARLTCALVRALQGRKTEAESLLALAREPMSAGTEGRLELGSALVMLELGSPARAAHALERAGGAGDAHRQPAWRSFSHVLLARMGLLEGATASAIRSALEGLSALPPGLDGAPLAVLARLTAAECVWASGDVLGAEACLDRIPAEPGPRGVLAARMGVLQARFALARGRVPVADTRALLTRTIRLCERLGDSRGLALAYLACAHAARADGTEAPAVWLARAQPLLATVGTAAELRLLRQSFHALGRRTLDRVIDTNTFSVMDTLRARYARLRDVLAAQRDTSRAASFSREVEESLESVHLAEEAMISTTEHSLLERERLGQLVTVGQRLSSFDDLEPLLDALPSLAAQVMSEAVIGVVERTAEAGFVWRARSSHPERALPPCPPEVAGAVLRAGSLQLLPESLAVGAGCAVLPLPCAGRTLGLVVGRTEPRARLSPGELDRLSVLGSLYGATLARVGARATQRRTAARDAATLEAIRDGILNLDARGLVTAINPAARRLLRIEPEPLLGRRLQDVPSLAALGEWVASGRSPAEEVIPLPHGELLVRAHSYEEGMLLTLQEFASAQRLAHKLVGSQARCSFEDLIGRAPAFLACLEDARLAARSDVPLLITGESGTGKELLAQSIHRASPKAHMPFVGINVAAFPRELLESELFGYERGAFTGARTGGNPGKLELADRGTVLLDEIGDMPLAMQVKLLRVLQERTFQRLGASRDLTLQARVIATTHRDLEAAIADGSFRLDLFHRLRVVHLRLPALRERGEDIPLLVEHHLRRHALRLGRPVPRVTPQVMDALLAYAWPGNVRELANLLEGAASLLPDRENTLCRIPPAIERALQARAGARAGASALAPSGPEPVLPFEEVERRAFENALRHFAGNVTQAAKALGVAKATFYSKIHRYGLMEAGPVTEPPRRLRTPPV